MKITQDDIQSMDKVGESDKGDVYHVLTKGGLNLMIEKTQGGDMTILGHGPHRSFAKQKATAMKNVKWHENLFKSEDADALAKAPREFIGPGGRKTVHYTPEEAEQLKQEQEKKDMENMHLSNPENHYKMGSYYAKRAGQERERQKGLNMFNNPVEHHEAGMNSLMHLDSAIKHFKMAGLSDQDLHRETDKYVNLHHELQPGEQPHIDPHIITNAWMRKNPGKQPPVGLEYNWQS
jgi:hypothetical protein